MNIITPPQSNLAYTNKVTAEIEAALKKEKAVQYLAANIGKGNPRIYYNENQENERSDYAQIFVQLHEETSPDEKLALIEKYRKLWTPYPGAKVELKNFEQGTGITAPIEVRVYGDNLDTLRTYAGKVETLLKHIEGTIYVR